MFKRNKKKIGCETPKYSYTTPPPPPTSESNAHKPNPNYVPPASVEKPCPYETPCGWCTKWDKKCDKKIGCEKSDDLITFSPEFVAKVKEGAEKSRKMKRNIWFSYIFNEYGGNIR